MATIADNLLLLAATKAKLKQNLIYAGIDSSAENNFSNLVDMPFDAADEFSPDPAWPQDLSAWTPDGGIGLIISDYGMGKTSFIIDTDGGDYAVVVNDGTQDLSSTSYATGATCDIDVGAGLGTVYRAVKITSASPIRRFRVARPASISAGTETYQIPLLYFYGRLSTLNNCANMFFATAASRCSQLQAVHIDDTASVTSMASMFYSCYSLRAVPAIMNTASVTSMASMFHTCYSLQAVPAIMNTASVTSMASMFYSCYSLRAVPAIMNTASVTNMSYMFCGCSSLRSVPAIMNTANVTSMAGMFSGCYSLRAVPATFSVVKVVGMEDFGATMRSLSRTLLDLSAAVITTKLKITEAAGLKGLLVCSAATWTGTAPQIDIQDCGLDRTALVVLFDSLGTIAGKTIKITGNPGVPDLTAGDLAIATGKGWTVVTA